MKNLLQSLLIITILSIASSCEITKEKRTEVLKEGTWRGVITMQGMELPFNFIVKKDSGNYKITLINSVEKIELDEVIVKNDSVFITLHIFDININAKIKGNKLEGFYRKNYLEGYELPFTATFDDEHTYSENPTSNNSKFDGKWQVKFTEPDGKTYPSIGLFDTNEEKSKGTFLTPLGDYRYLEGFTNGDEMLLSTFDGNHAFIFKATLINDSTLVGDFWSGKYWHETWTATKNAKASLPSDLELTYIKEGYEKIDFSFPDLEGNPISPTDEKYKNKVVLLQIFGTWCPNCMDETKFYADWYAKNKGRGVEIIALAYEQKDDFEYAKSRVTKMKERYQANYDFLIAGTSNKKAASKSLPMLNEIISFPTSIFIDRKGNVRRVHTGFTGPATGVYYEQFVEDFNDFMDQLLKENSN